MNRSASFILLGEVRTGGTVLADSLSNHAHLKVLGEVFVVSPDHAWTAWRRPIVERLYTKEPDISPSSNLVPMLNYLFEHYNGFVLHRQGQIEEGNPSWSYLAGLDDLKIIHLYRENLFLQYFSERLAVSSKVWNLERPDQPRPEWTPMTVDVKHCLSTIRQRKRCFEWTRHLFARQSSITIRYEEIQADIHRVLDYCQGFLEVPLERLPVNLRKLTDRTPRELIANYGEVEEGLRGTEFATFLDSSEAPASGVAREDADVGPAS